MNIKFELLFKQKNDALMLFIAPHSKYLDEIPRNVLLEIDKISESVNDISYDNTKCTVCIMQHFVQQELVFACPLCKLNRPLEMSWFNWYLQWS